MAHFTWFSPDNKQRYDSIDPNDPNVPSDWVMSETGDGTQDREQQTFVAGVNNGGPPPYADGDPVQGALFGGAVPNGILGNYDPNRPHAK